MKHICFRRWDKYPARRAYTIRYIDNPGNVVEITNWIQSVLTGSTPVAFDYHSKHHEDYTLSFKENGQKVVVPFGNFLVLTANGHFMSMTEEEFFEEYFIA